MKAFNLEKALAGEKVITRDGREVAQLHVFDCDSIQTLYGVMEDHVEQWNCIGEYHAGTAKHATNLFMAPKKLSGFVNVYLSAADSFSTRKAADDMASPERIVCIDLSQFDEGHGL